MFERNILRDHFAELSPDGGEPSTLRALGWGELVARLKAASDCRAELDAIAPITGGRFDQYPKLAERAQRDGKRAVNRNALGHGKISQAHGGEAAIAAASGDREN